MRLEHLVRMVKSLENSQRQAQRARDNARERTARLPGAQERLMRRAAGEVLVPDDRLEHAAAEYVKLVRGVRSAKEAEQRNERDARDAAEHIKRALGLED